MEMPLRAEEEKRILPLGLDWGRWAVLNNGIYFVDSNQPKPVISFFDFASRTDRNHRKGTSLRYSWKWRGDIMLVENFR